jgi:hypothetical protein
MPVGLYRKNKKTSIVAAATEDSLYTGSINREEDKDANNHFLLAFNKKTGKVRLIAVDKTTMTNNFNPTVNNVVESRTIFDFNTSLNNLNKAFGSKKVKRITEQKERLKMNIDNIKEQLEQTVANIKMNETESIVVESNENDSAYRPTIHRDASTVEQVYILSELVPDFVLDSLEKEANEVLSSDVDSIEMSELIKDKLRELQDSSGDVNKCKLLLYIGYLMKYVMTPAKYITKRFVVCQSSREVNTHILDNFSVTTSAGRGRPISLRDKTICYILVLAMIAMDFQINVEALSKSVKVGVKKLHEITRVLAFSSHRKNKDLVILKLPLPPAVSTSPKKRKRY